MLPAHHLTGQDARTRVSSYSRAGRLARGAFWLFVGMFATMIVTAIGGPIL